MRAIEASEQQHRCRTSALDPLGADALEGSVPSRFRLAAAAHPGCLALDDGRTRLTYGELDAWANGIARAVVERRGDEREPVALLFRQGSASVAATLGTLAAGRPYVPLDAADPPSRLTGIAD